MVKGMAIIWATGFKINNQPCTVPADGGHPAGMMCCGIIAFTITRDKNMPAILLVFIMLIPLYIVCILTLTRSLLLKE